MSKGIGRILKENLCSLYCTVGRYNSSHLLEEKIVPVGFEFDETQDIRIADGSNEWAVSFRGVAVQDR